MSPLGRALLGCSTSRSTISTVRVEGLRMSFVLYDCVSRRKDEVSEMSSSKRSSMSSLRRLRDAFSSSFTSDTSSLTSLTMVERRPNRQSRKTRPAQIPETKYRATRSGRPAGHQTECNMCWCKTHPVPRATNYSWTDCTGVFYVCHTSYSKCLTLCITAGIYRRVQWLYVLQFIWVVLRKCPLSRQDSCFGWFIFRPSCFSCSGIETCSILVHHKTLTLPVPSSWTCDLLLGAPNAQTIHKK